MQLEGGAVKNWCLILFICMASLSVSACGDDPGVALTCDDILPADQVSFEELATLMKFECGFCHTKDSPVYGYDYSSAGAAYDSTAYKPRMVYFQLASGTMPPGGQWNDDNLKLFRSWYCHGALYE
jgi:hypothetical protein